MGRSSRPSDGDVAAPAIHAATQGRGFGLILVLIALPFLAPIPHPGLSTPFGLVAVIIGARLPWEKRPWLPARLLRRELPARFVSRILAAGRIVVRWLEVLARPRFEFLPKALRAARSETGAGTPAARNPLRRFLPPDAAFTRRRTGNQSPRR
jgi:hypothetical protein